ncbi:MAG: thioredoxin family protein [bacterium]
MGNASPITSIKQILEAETPILLYFRADWCPVCKEMDRVAHDLGIQFSGRLQVLTVDAEESYPLAKEYGVTAVPTFILFVNGSAKTRMTGQHSRSDLARLIRLYVY